MAKLEQLEQLVELAKLAKLVGRRPMPGLADIQLLVLQPTPFCNLNCTYCYLPDRSLKAQMTPETLTAVGRSIVASPFFREDSTVVWHAGEPLVLPPDWYADAIAQLEAASGRKIKRQSFQTNATLIDNNWITYFRKPGVSVGVSLDGPAFLNDQWRVGRGGQGTYDKAMDGIARLRFENIPFHIIAVVSAASLAHPEEIADALVATGAYSIGLNVEEIEGINTSSSLLGKITVSQYSDFLIRFVDRVETHQNPPRLRELDQLMQVLKTRPDRTPRRNQENTAGAIISVVVGGEISTFSPELLGTPAPDHGGFSFGNVHGLRDLGQIYFDSQFLRTLRQISAGITACQKSCAHFDLCGGGAPANKLGEHGRFDVAETAHCRLSIKTSFDALLSRIEATAPVGE
ncbi:cyclophane-forming radical SAM/SPASM peptide maturase GrrM/OscB [Litoreibacter roseus]|uniref:Radical SAM protein n=1 Tax=Litoreibacter roseus TaxID=2601869 RepID=A0A6N6JKI8_9RHOB|nr:cyclophane-forming radical SAM/SPASM peptide maturase GrrM/OscB [Litoreibacter roseus]GFE65788.1 radical SAM protein [Litoreibacter roseus]